MPKQSTVNSVPVSKQFVSIKNYSSVHRNNPKSLQCSLYSLSQMHSVFLRVPWAITLSGRETLPEFLSYSLPLVHESAFQLRTKYPRCTRTISKYPQRRKNSVRLARASLNSDLFTLNYHQVKWQNVKFH